MFQQNSFQSTNPNLTYQRGLRNGFLAVAGSLAIGLGLGGIAEYFNPASFEMKTFALGFTALTSSMTANMGHDVATNENLHLLREKNKGLRDVSLVATGLSLAGLAAIHLPKTIQAFQP